MGSVGTENRATVQRTAEPGLSEIPAAAMPAEVQEVGASPQRPQVQRTLATDTTPDSVAPSPPPDTPAPQTGGEPGIQRQLVEPQSVERQTAEQLRPESTQGEIARREPSAEQGGQPIQTERPTPPTVQRTTESKVHALEPSHVDSDPATGGSVAPSTIVGAGDPGVGVQRSPERRTQPVARPRRKPGTPVQRLTDPRLMAEPRRSDRGRVGPGVLPQARGDSVQRTPDASVGTLPDLDMPVRRLSTPAQASPGFSTSARSATGQQATRAQTLVQRQPQPGPLPQTIQRDHSGWDMLIDDEVEEGSEGSETSEEDFSQSEGGSAPTSGPTSAPPLPPRPKRSPPPLPPRPTRAPVSEQEENQDTLVDSQEYSGSMGTAPGDHGLSSVPVDQTTTDSIIKESLDTLSAFSTNRPRSFSEDSSSGGHSEPGANLDEIARQILPLIRRMLAVERERRPSR